MANTLDTIKIGLVNNTLNSDIQVLDLASVPVDATALKLTIMDLGSNILWTDDYFQAGTNIVKPSGTTGYYYYPFGALTITGNNPNIQTNSIKDFIFKWDITTAASQTTSILQNVKIVSALLMYQLPYLRQLIDKSRKLVDPDNDVFLGYSTSQLIMYYESAMQILNQYQPESAIFTVDNFPWQTYRHIALQSALLAGVMSQELFALDTDIPNYSDQGISFSINHQAPLAAFLTQIAARLDHDIPMFKLQFVSTGSISSQVGPNSKLSALISAAPSGALFRNWWVKGGY